jgi:hypothetical protein
MPATNAPVLTVDAEGIWREDAPGRRFGIAWDEIYCISGYKLDCMARVVAVVTLDWDFGEFFELMDDWSGFDEVVRMITSRVPGIDPGWIDRIRSLEPRQPGIEVWKRA